MSLALRLMGSVRGVLEMKSSLHGQSFAHLYDCVVDSQSIHLWSDISRKQLPRHNVASS